MRHTRKNKRGGVGLSDVTSFFKGNKTEPLLQSEVPSPEMPAPSPEMPAPSMAPLQMPELMPKPMPITMDEALKEIAGLTGYHMRSIINSISICNSTMKMQNNTAGVGNSVLNAFGRGNESKIEMNECGSQCEARSNTVKEVLTKLLILSEGNNALGFIASKTAAVNSANYIGNSTVSLANKGATTASEAASAAANSVGNFFGLTKRTPTQGGRKRTRRR